MYSLARTQLFFYKNIQFFQKPKAHLFSLCYIPVYRECLISEGDHKVFFSQPHRRRRRRRYFRYDMYLWVKGAEGFLSHKRLLRILRTKSILRGPSKYRQPTELGSHQYNIQDTYAMHTPSDTTEG